ncbi:MAG TPA: SUKH-4 family immunity protein [Actinospica sp.]|jgi:hypothetical protein|nr:SUKH-4 family immunity protein [Actinospica sp.]
MRIDGDRLYYETPGWSPYDLGALGRAKVPRTAATVLGGRGLPHNAYEIFIRDQTRELSVAELPGCGPAAFLADYTDQDNSYWVSLSDGSIWMRWGAPGHPAHEAARINTTVGGLQSVLAAWCDLKACGLDENDGEDYEQAVAAAVVRAVGGDADAFADDEGWWPSFFLELEFTLPRMPAGDAHLLPARAPGRIRAMGARSPRV